MTRAGRMGARRSSALRVMAPQADPTAFLRRTLASLDAGGVRYALLRDDEDAFDADSRAQEVDLLVASDHVRRAAAALAPLGFVPGPSWGHAPHHFFVAYDSATGVWWKLDVVTALRYGRPIRCLGAGDGDESLRRALPDRRLAPAEEFFGLLLHCLLDDGAFSPKHRRRLAALQRDLSQHPASARMAAAHVDEWLAPVLTWSVVDQAIVLEDWDRLTRRRSDLVSQLFWRRPLASLWHYLSARALRALRPLLFAVFRRGPVVALLGPDGAGKTTLAHGLLAEEHLRARRIYMGTGGEAGDTWRGFTALRPRTGGRGPAIVRRPMAFLARMAEHWRRAAAAHYHRLRGRLVLFDRYTFDEGPAGARVSIGRRLRRWLVRAGSPRPDLVIVLDAPAEVLFRRKGEHTPERLEQMRLGYLALAARLSGVVLDAGRDGESVKRSVVHEIWTRLSRRRPEREVPS